MDQSKPFKTIEVIDSRSGSLCKIACMSCIRGHRTTSCGNTACRSKVFWTIKRPGRPANTCTCPYGRSGRCQCVVAQTACPHKPKKGEKRTVDCRCDEKGRWCCMLDPKRWDALVALQKPRVDFYPSPEAMTATRQPYSNGSTILGTTASNIGAAQHIVALPRTPQPMLSNPQTGVNAIQLDSLSTTTFEVPRFGLMGVGLPMGSEGHQADDVLAWEGEAPMAPRTFQLHPTFPSPGSTTITNSSMLSTVPTTPSSHFTEPIPSESDFAPVTQSFERISMMPHDSSQDLPSEWMQDYMNYQFPSAICQNCGMSGCTCKSCPAVMQSTMDGSWAKCCSRKHVQDIAPLPARVVQQGQQTFVQTPIPNGSLGAEPVMNGIVGLNARTYGPESFTFGAEQAFSMDMSDFTTTTDSDMLDFNDFVITEHPEPSSGGCCCSGKR